MQTQTVYSNLVSAGDIQINALDKKIFSPLNNPKLSDKFTK